MKPHPLSLESPVPRTPHAFKHAVLRNDLDAISTYVASNPPSWPKPVSWDEAVVTTVMWGSVEALNTVLDVIDWRRPKASDRQSLLRHATSICMERDWVEKFKLCLNHAPPTANHKLALQCNKHRAPQCLKVMLEKLEETSPFYSSSNIARLYMERSDHTWPLIVADFVQKGHTQELLNGMEELGGVMAWKGLAEDLAKVQKDLDPELWHGFVHMLEDKGYDTTIASLKFFPSP